MSQRPRVAAGTPEGGRFAPTARVEPETGLAGPENENASQQVSGSRRNPRRVTPGPEVEFTSITRRPTRTVAPGPELGPDFKMPMRRPARRVDPTLGALDGEPR